MSPSLKRASEEEVKPRSKKAESGAESGHCICSSRRGPPAAPGAEAGEGLLRILEEAKLVSVPHKRGVRLAFLERSLREATHRFPEPEDRAPTSYLYTCALARKCPN